MKKKIVDFILLLTIVIGILIIVSFIFGAVIQIILSIISGNFFLMGLPAVFVAIYGIYVLFSVVKELIE